MNPQTYRTSEEAIRAFRTACEQEGSQFQVHGEDFTLLYIGDYCIDTGDINPVKPQMLANGSEFSSIKEEN